MPYTWYNLSLLSRFFSVITSLLHFSLLSSPSFLFSIILFLAIPFIPSPTILPFIIFIIFESLYFFEVVLTFEGKLELLNTSLILKLAEISINLAHVERARNVLNLIGVLSLTTGSRLCSMSEEARFYLSWQPSPVIECLAWHPENSTHQILWTKQLQRTFSFLLLQLFIETLIPNGTYKPISYSVL